jgi:putative hydrolase
MDLPDLHVQTCFSDGSAPVQFYVEEANRRGIKDIGIADHYSLWHKMDTTGKFLRYLARLQRYPVYIGVEVDIGYELPLLPSMRKQLDFVMAGLHRLHGRRLFFLDSSSLGNPQKFVREMMEAMITSMEHHDFDVISHPTQLPPSLRSRADKLITDEWAKNFISAAATYDVAIEVNCGMKLPDKAFVKKCIREGVKIATGSSAHVPAKVGDLDYARQLIGDLRVEDDQIYRPRNLKKGMKYRAMIKRAELKGKQLKLEIQLGANDLTFNDLELAIFYEKEKEVGKRIIIPSRVYREVSRNILALDYVPNEVDIRLYEGGDRIDHLVLFRRELETV